jgi:hypothetical protein
LYGLLLCNPVRRHYDKSTNASNRQASQVFNETCINNANGNVSFCSTVIGTVYPAGDPAVLTAYSDFLSRYDALAFEQCDSFLTGDLAGLVLTAGVYCIECDQGRSNHGDDGDANDETGGTPAHPGRKGHDD